MQRFCFLFRFCVEYRRNNNVWFPFPISGALSSFSYLILSGVFLEFPSPLPKYLSSIGVLFERSFSMRYNAIARSFPMSNADDRAFYPPHWE